MVKLKTPIVRTDSSSSRPGKFEQPMMSKKNVRRLSTENYTTQSFVKRKSDKTRPLATEKKTQKQRKERTEHDDGAGERCGSEERR